MIQFIAIYLLCLRDTYLKRMFTGRQVTNNSLLRHHIATRTPIGTGQIRRSQRFFNLFCRIPLITYICGNSWYQPYSRGRIKTAERSTVITPRNEIQHLLAINRHDVPFLHKLISATMSSVRPVTIYFKRTFLAAFGISKSITTSLREKISG